MARQRTNTQRQRTLAVTLGGQLRLECTAVVVEFTGFGLHRAFTREQREQAARPFNAKARYVSGGKKLIDTKTPEVLAVSNLRTRATAYWYGVTLPYVKTGRRLIRRETIPAFDAQMGEFRDEQRVLANALQERWVDIREQAQADLQDLFDSTQYPANIAQYYTLRWEYTNEDPPDYLKQLAPDVYERQCEIVAARFEQAVALAEETFVEQFGQLVENMSARLGCGDDGKPLVFHRSSVENLKEFFDRYRSLSVRSNSELDSLVEQAKGLIEGRSPGELRENMDLRQQIKTGLEGVMSRLQPMMTEKRPRRSFFFEDGAEVTAGE